MSEPFRVSVKAPTRPGIYFLYPSGYDQHTARVLTIEEATALVESLQTAIAEAKELMK